MRLTLRDNEMMAKGREEGREEGKILSIRNLMDTLKLSAQQAMDALKISSEEQQKYLSMI